MSDEWFLWDGEAERGPLSRSDILSRISAHGSPDRLSVWREGFPEWLPAHKVFDLWKPASEAHNVGSEAVAKPTKQVSYTKKYAGIGVLVGLGIAAADYFFEWRGAKFAAWQGSGIAENIGYLFGSSLTASIIGSVIGAIRGTTTRTEKQDASASVTFESGVQQTVVSKSKSGNFFVRHWRGEYPLWVSYWLICFVFSFVAQFVLVLLIGKFKPTTGVGPNSILILFVSLWGTLTAIAVWQIVGTWRSANRNIEWKAQQQKGAFWAKLAKVALFFGVLQFGSVFLKVGVPQLSEAIDIAFYDDPSLPNYTIKVIRNGTEVEIAGGIKFGLADELSAVLKATRQIKVIHLDSIGGRLAEGYKLYELIRQRELTTYVSSTCLSACTVAFAGGRERVLRSGATLGFHRGVFAGQESKDGPDVQRTVFTAAGFSADFIHKALSTPNKDMWKPSTDLLINAGVITRASDGNEFALSGFGKDVSKTELDATLVKSSSIYAALKERYPKSYDELLNNFHAGALNGYSRGDVINQMRRRLLSHVKALLPLADEDVLLDFVRLTADQYDALGARDATACYGYASGLVPGDYVSQFSADLRIRELQINERIIRTAAQRATRENSSGSWPKITQGMVKRGFAAEELGLLTSKTVDRSKHGRYCALASAMYREIVALPQSEAGPMLRNIFAAK